MDGKDHVDFKGERRCGFYRYRVFEECLDVGSVPFFYIFNLDFCALARLLRRVTINFMMSLNGSAK